MKKLLPLLLLCVTLPTIAYDSEDQDIYYNITSGSDMVLDVNHRPIYEEYTGMWCGYCPRGAVWMAIMKDLYPEDFIGISYHYGDALQMLNKSDFPDTGNSYPRGYFDRQGNNYTSALSSPWKARSNVSAPANIDIDAMLRSAQDSIICTAELIFAEEAIGDDYEVEFILVADSLYNDSWEQSNYYSGSTQSSYAEYWQVYTEGDSYVSGLYFNDVAIATSRVSSTGNVALPSSITAVDTLLVSYTHTMSSFGGLEEYMGVDIKNLKIVALLIEKSSGEVLNACETHVYLESDDSGKASITSIMREVALTISGDNGQITITSGDDMRVNIHTIGGQLVASKVASQGETFTIKVPAGIYIVNGLKVVVK